MSHTHTHVRTRRALLPALATALVLAAGLSACGGEASGEATADGGSVTVEDPWVRATTGTEDPTMTAAFMVIDNDTDEDVSLTDVSSPVADTVQVHEMAMVDGAMQMKEVDGGLTVTAGRGKVLEPGGYHLMLMGVHQDLAPGDEVDLTLEFSDGETQKLSVPVKEFTEEEGHYHSDGHSHSHGAEERGRRRGQRHGRHGHVGRLGGLMAHPESSASGSSGLGRRGFLGYVGSAVAGAAAGTAGGAAVASTQVAGAADPAPPGRQVSPHGVHQPGVAAPTPSLVEVVALDLHPDVERDALARLLRLWTGDIEAITTGRAAPGDPAPWLAAGMADLTVTVGFGGGAFTSRLLGTPPPGLVDVPPMRHDRLQPRWCGGDVALLVGGRDGTTVSHAVRRLVADAAPFARQRWRQVGFWNGTDEQGRPMTGRNLFGQVDGSGNPSAGSREFDQTVWIDRGPWAGGTSLVVRRIAMHLDTWSELTRDEQERAVGRRLSDGAPLTGGDEHSDLDLAARRGGRLVIPGDAHARMAHPSLNGGARIFRRGASYTQDRDTGSGTVTESGLVFMSFQASVADQFVPVQRALDESDALNEWTTAIGSATFAILPGFEAGDWLGAEILGDAEQT